MAIKVTNCCDKMNINTLEREKFCLDANGDVCINTCESRPDGDANICKYGEGIYEAADIGTEVCFLSCTVPADNLLWLEQVVAAFNGTGQFTVKVSGNTVMRLITSPAQPTISIKFENSKSIAAGDTVEICFCGPCEGDYSATLIGTQFSTT